MSNTARNADIEASLESVLSTEQLNARPSRPPDYELENHALLAIAQHMADSPRTSFQKLADVALEICRAGSAGVSLLSKEIGYFHWSAIAGEWKSHAGDGTPRHFGPCGLVLDRNASQLFTRPERYYPHLVPVAPAIEEALLTPFYVQEKAVGVLWVIAHDASRKFDGEDLRLIESLGRLAAAAYPLCTVLTAQDEQEEQSQSLRDVNAKLLVSSVHQHELTEQAEKAEALVREREERMTVELATAQRFQRRLHETSTRLIREDNDDVLYEQILDGTLAIMHSDLGNIQVLGEGEDALRMLVFRGFEPKIGWIFGVEAATGVATREGHRVIVPDVETCQFLAGTPALEDYRKAGIRAVQSTPLLSRSGRLLGMLSTHWRNPHQPAEQDLHLLDVLARQAADLIERSQVERALRASEERLRRDVADMELLQEISTRFGSGLKLTEMLRASLDAAIALTRAQRGNVQLLDASTGTLRIAAQRGFQKPFLDYFEQVHDGQAACGAAMQRAGRVIIEDVRTSDLFAGNPALEVMLEAGAHAVISTPLRARSGSVLGMLSTHFEAPHRPSLRDFQFLDILAQQTADFIERCQADEVLRASEERYRTLVSVITDVPWTTDPAGRFIAPQPMWTVYTGQTWEQSREFGWANALHPEDRADILAIWESACKTRSLYQSKGRIWHAATQSYRYFEARATPVLDQEGNVREWVGACTDFEEKKRSDEQLRRAMEFDEAVMANMGEGLYTVDAAGVVTSMNPAAEELFGWSFEELHGKRMHDATHHHYPDGTPFPAEDCPGLQVLKQGKPLIDNGDVFIRKDGTFFDVVYSSAPLRSGNEIVGLVVVFRDITERKQSEAAVREASERLRFMAESMPQKIFTAKPNGELGYFNRQWLDFTGLTFDQLTKGWNQFVHPGELEENVRLWQHSVDTGEPFEFVHRFQRADGSYRWHLSRACAMRDVGGKISMWIGSNTDIHEEKETEEELRRANEDLNQFAFAASHDFQEPLRMITSYSQLLLKGYSGQLDGEAAVCVDFIAEGTKRMRELLTDLLSFTEAGAEGQEAAESIDLNLIFQKASQNLETAIEETGAIVTSDHLPSVQGRQAHFVQLFQNLIGNAIKYRGERAPRVHLSAERRNSEWLFSVSDNGIGIEREYHQQIFGVFKRLHGKVIPGTGIGLAICQRVVERYGGRIWVESEVGHGSTFYFALPALGSE